MALFRLQRNETKKIRTFLVIKYTDSEMTKRSSYAAGRKVESLLSRWARSIASKLIEFTATSACEVLGMLEDPKFIWIGENIEGTRCVIIAVGKN